MKTRLLILAAGLMMFSACGKKLKPTDVAGSYAVADSWKSSIEMIGTGNLNYDLDIVADGEDGVILMNVNKTLSGVKGKLKGDEILIDKQTIASPSGNLYDVLPGKAKIMDQKIMLTFTYSDEERANGIGKVTCDIMGSKKM